MNTLVIGARGAVGRHVVEGLRTAGVPVRASVRNRAQADFPSGVEVVQADLTQPASLGPALDGISRVFLYADPGSATDFAKAALAAGVERVVLLSSGSVLLPWATSNSIAIEHRVTEALTLREQVEVIADAIGEPILIEILDECQARTAFGADQPPETVDAILHFVRRGTEADGWVMTTTAERVLGPRPASYREWVGDHLGDLR